MLAFDTVVGPLQRLFVFSCTDVKGIMSQNFAVLVGEREL
jgi:hypothetical protein